MRIRIQWPRDAIEAELRDTPTSCRLAGALPIESRAQVWGDEVYFRLPFSAPAEPDAAEVVDKGAVCFWIDGDSLALLFGPTPVSQGDECRLISPANLLGRMLDDPERLRSVVTGDLIRVLPL